MKDLLYDFCCSKDFETCLNILKERLKHQNQMDVYDSLYIPFVKTLSVEDNYEDIIIPELEYFIKLLSLSLIYKEELFPGKNQGDEFTDDNLDFISKSFDKQYTMKSFFITMYNINDFQYHENDDQIEYITFSRKRISCIYILLHNAGNLSFTTSIDMLLNEDFAKCFMSIKIYVTESGPHNGMFKNSSKFLIHDYGHYETVQYNFDFYDLSKLIKLRKELPMLSLQNRFLNIFAQSYIFETDYYKNKVHDIMYYYDEFSKNPFEFYDLYDHIYIIKYLLESYDLKLSSEELKIISNLNDNYLDLKKDLKKYDDLRYKDPFPSFDLSIEDQNKHFEHSHLMTVLYDKAKNDIETNSMEIYQILKQYI